MHVPSVPQRVIVPQEATIPQAVTIPQAETEPRTSRFTSTDVFKYSHDLEEHYNSSKAPDKIGIIDCVTSSSYLVRSNYEKCLKLNDRSFNSRVNSKNNVDTTEHTEFDIIQQNEDEHHNGNGSFNKKNFTYTGSYYSKSPSDGYYGSLSLSNSILTTTSDSVNDSGSERPFTSSNEILSPTGGELDTTDLYEPIDQINIDKEFDIQYHDYRNTIFEPESESDYSSFEDQAGVYSVSGESRLSPSDSKFLDSPSSSLSQDNPYDDSSDSFNPPHDISVSDNSLVANDDSISTLDQSDIPDFDLEGEFPLPTSQTLPNLSSTEDYTDIFGSTQPDYGHDTSPTIYSGVERMRSSSMPTFQDISDTSINEIKLLENSNSAGSGQVQHPSVIDEANTIIVPEDQSDNEPSAEEVQFFEDEANDEDE